MKEIKEYKKSVFENIKHINEYGAKFWCARELAQALDYAKWSNFEKVIEKAKISCKGSGNEVSDHFADV